MFDSDAETLAWYENDRDTFLARSARVLREWIERERANKKAGASDWWKTWKWSDAFAEVLQRPASSVLVQSASERMSEKMPRNWRLEQYDDREAFDRLVDRFEDAVREASD